MPLFPYMSRAWLGPTWFGLRWQTYERRFLSTYAEVCRVFLLFHPFGTGNILGEREQRITETPSLSPMDFQVVVLAGGTSKNLVPLVSKVPLSLSELTRSLSSFISSLSSVPFNQTTRLIPQEIPKALLPVANRPVLSYVLELLELSNLKDLIVVWTVSPSASFSNIAFRVSASWILVIILGSIFLIEMMNPEITRKEWSV